MVVTKEEKEPELLKNFDEKFEIELALKIAHLNWKMNVSFQLIHSIIRYQCKTFFKHQIFSPPEK